MIDALISRLQKVRKTQSGYMACCPAHDDKSPSLTVTERDGRILIHCFAGCEPDDVLEKLGLTWDDLFEDRWEAARNGFGNYAVYRMEKNAKAFDPVEQDKAVLIFAMAVWKEGRELGIEDAARVQLAIERLEYVNECTG